MSPVSRATGRRLVVEADGGSRGNPGIAGYGALVRDPTTGRVLVELAEPLGTASNNVAEYSGLIAGLRAVLDIDPGATVRVKMDSKLVVEQMSGRWKIKHEDMRRLALEARDLCAAISEAGGSVDFEWVPREKNKAADALSNDAMDGTSVHRVLVDDTTTKAEPAGSAESASEAGSRSDVAAAARPLRLLLVQAPLDDAAVPRIVTAVRRLVGAGTTVVGPIDGMGARVTSALAAALESEATTSGDWLGEAPGEGADETVRTAYRGLVASGGTVVAVTSRRGVLSVLTDVLGTPVERFWALATAPGSLTAVEVWEDGSASVAFTNRTDHLA
ncbi:reverse transcriptase-like protein [Terrabacter sp. MAHUQ-38]|uniref:reverse transcriptase-like protein n=1 Tax=unclassified Terrabacter TaxID=2630222 RepID=UPI00165EA822|nr:reverse transcriptase-like protein [Terrabacter sp. MAHUQ-38]